MATTKFLLIFALSIAFALFTGNAGDPNMLQDFCVGTKDPNNNLFVNGYFCKNPMEVTSDDFHFKNIDVSVSFNNKMGCNGTLVTAQIFQGLNTMGIAVGRAEYAPKGLLTLHFHPRASEILTVIKGTFYVGFVDGKNKLFSKILNPGDVFVFPQGLVHFSHNIADTHGVAILAYNHQRPDFYPLAPMLFKSDPPIFVDLLSKAFQLDAKIIEGIQSEFRN